jgi:hypothetical protein
MQTFLPLSDYHQSMRCLDKTRLGNQVWREGLTLIRGGWPNHPASKMWRGYEWQLSQYLLAGLDVLTERNGKPYNELRDKIVVERNKHKPTPKPPWVGDESFHASHRSNLLRKVIEAEQKAESSPTNRNIVNAIYQRQWYSQFRWTEPPDLPYIWPKS